MRRNDEAVRAPTASGIHTPGITASASASAALRTLRHDRGPQVIELSTCSAVVSVAKVHDRHDFNPHEHHVTLGVVADCPVYADIRHIGLCLHQLLVIDVHTISHGGTSVFITRPESRAERQQRVFAERSRTGGFC